MSWFTDSIACGLLSALTWSSLVWMSYATPIQNFTGWLQGIGITSIVNMLLWFFLASVKLSFPVWAVLFFLLNLVVGITIESAFRQNITIPRVWAFSIHPVIITVMNVLLGGALGAIL